MNLSFFPVRRIDLIFNITYQEDLEKIRRLFLETAANNPLSLEDPIPSVSIQNFNDSAILIQLSVWVNRENYNDLKNQLLENIKAAFTKQQMAIPFPCYSLYSTVPLRIAITPSSETPKT